MHESSVYILTSISVRAEYIYVLSGLSYFVWIFKILVFVMLEEHVS